MVSGSCRGPEVWLLKKCWDYICKILQSSASLNGNGSQCRPYAFLKTLTMGTSFPCVPPRTWPRFTGRRKGEGAECGRRDAPVQDTTAAREHLPAERTSHQRAASSASEAAASAALYSIASQTDKRSIWKLKKGDVQGHLKAPLATQKASWKSSGRGGDKIYLFVSRENNRIKPIKQSYKCVDVFV